MVATKYYKIDDTYINGYGSLGGTRKGTIPAGATPGGPHASAI
jgi:hypothetical protein